MIRVRESVQGTGYGTTTGTGRIHPAKANGKMLTPVRDRISANGLVDGLGENLRRIKMSTVDAIGFTLREMADQYESTIKLMNGAANKIRAKVQGADEHTSVIDDVLMGNRYYAQLSLAKRSLEIEMADAICDHAIYDWAMGVPGLNRVTICRIVGLIPMDTKENFFEFSKLLSFSGYAPGKDKLVKGQKATFSRRLKTALFVATDTVLKSSGVVAKQSYRPTRLYSEIYKTWRHTYAHRHGVGTTGAAWLTKNGLEASIDEYKEFEERNKKQVPVWPDARQHAAARRKVINYLLAHVWRAWRMGLGWDFRPMYFHEVLGHEFKEDLWDYSSPELAVKKKKQRLSIPELESFAEDIEDVVSSD